MNHMNVVRSHFRVSLTRSYNRSKFKNGLLLPEIRLYLSQFVSIIKVAIRISQTGVDWLSNNWCGTLCERSRVHNTKCRDAYPVFFLVQARWNSTLRNLLKDGQKYFSLFCNVLDDYVLIATGESF